MGILDYELQFGVKEFVVISLGFVAFLSVLIAMNFYIKSIGPQLIPPGGAGGLNSVNGAFVLASPAAITPSSFCDIFVSTPSKHIRFLQTISCGSMNITKFSSDDILSLGNGEKGTYMLIVYSNDTSEGKVFSLNVGNEGG